MLDQAKTTNGFLQNYYREEIPEEIRNEIDRFVLTDLQLEKMRRIMELEMENGLSKEKNVRSQSSLQMEITYVRDLCDGSEDGEFLALDLGGTNFRVLHVVMVKGVCVRCHSENYNVPERILTAPSLQLFDHLADSIGRFLQSQNLTGHYPLGFTYSFPMWQDGLTRGHLVTWTKSFRHPDGVGDDAVEQLNKAMHRRGIDNVQIVAILNDTTGTLMSGAYLDHRCQIGLILGTGSNACYMEHLEKIDKWTGAYDEPKQVVVDIEWGAFGDNHSLDFLKLEYDFQVDRNSNHVGSFTFEKLFSGMYIGEIARLVLVKLAREGLIFNGRQPSHRLTTEWSLTAKHISIIEQNNLEEIETVLKELELDYEETDVKVVRYLSEVLSERAAQLISNALSVILRRVAKPEVTIAVDGSYYRYHPTLARRMDFYLRQWAPDTRTEVILAEDGSGKGAGLVAAVVCRMKQIE